MRLKVQPDARARLLASMVLPTPGTSSISRCPAAARPMMASSASACLPIRTCSIAVTRFRRVCVPLIERSSNTVASLELLTRATRTRIVATYLRGRGDSPSRGADRRTGSAGSPRRAIGAVWRRVLPTPTGGAEGGRGRWRRGRRLLAHLQVIDRVHHVGANARLQVVEHRRCFDLVFDERVALAVRAQADAFAQVVDGGQVGDP